MSHEFIDRLEEHWDRYGGRPSQVVIDWLARPVTEASQAERAQIRRSVEPHLRKVEKTLLKIYLADGEPEEKWLEVLRRPGPMGLSDTLALTVIARWYADDPMDQLVRFNLLSGAPMVRRTRPNRAYLSPFSSLLSAIIPFLVSASLFSCIGGVVGGIIGGVTVYAAGESITGVDLLYGIIAGAAIGTLLGVVALLRGLVRKAIYGSGQESERGQ